MLIEQLSFVTIAYKTNEILKENCQKHAIAYETNEIIFVIKKEEQ